MADFKSRRHRLELPATPSTDDPVALKKAMDQMKRLVQDEFNRLATDFYDFKQTTYNAAVIPLRGVSNIAVVKDQYSVNATWELPDGDEITPTHIRVRILEISPNSWSLYSYPKTSWEFNGLTPGTQYTLQIQLVATFEATDTFVSTTRNCPSVPVLRTAESDIKSKVFTTDEGVGPPTDGGTNNTNITFNFPNTQGTPGTVGGANCWWEYKYQYRAACAWVDTGAGGAEVNGNVGNVVTDTAAAPFTTYPNAVFRLAYREICNSIPQDWVYGVGFMAVNYADADCLGIIKSASLTADPFNTADLLALPSVCQEDGTFLQIADALTDTEFFPNEPGFKCIEYIDNEWTLIADDTTNTAISNTIFTGLLSGELAAVGNLNAQSDFTLGFDIKVADNSLVLAGGTGAYDIIVLGGKIKVQMIQNVSSYSLQINVPRDGGGAYVFRADGCGYGAWVNFFYKHDVSEPDGRVLYVDGIIADRSVNAVENDFDGITNEVQINTVNDMQIRSIYGWDGLAVTPDLPLPTYSAFQEDYAAGTKSITLSYPAGAVTGDLVVAVIFGTSGNIGGANTGTLTTEMTRVGSTGNVRPVLYYRVIDGTESASLTIETNSTSVPISGFMMKIKGIDPVNPLEDFAYGSEISSGNITFPSITLSNPSYLLCLGTGLVNTNDETLALTSPSGSPTLPLLRAQDSETDLGSGYAAVRIWGGVISTTGATGAKTGDNETTWDNYYQGMQIGFKLA